MRCVAVTALLVVITAICASFFITTTNNDGVNWRVKYIVDPITRFYFRYCGIGESGPFSRERSDKFFEVIRSIVPVPNDNLTMSELTVPASFCATRAETLPNYTPGDVHLRLYVPLSLQNSKDETKLPLLVWMHGGGFAIGSIKDPGTDRMARRFANQLNMMVVSVEYRLAPEFPFPHALEDCYCAIRWLISDIAKEDSILSRLDVSRIALGGDSAGGNLATVTSILLRDRKEAVKIAHQMLFYPGLFVEEDTPSSIEFEDGYIIPLNVRNWFRKQYTNSDEKVGQSPYVCPTKTSLHDLPPAHIIAAELDPLRDEAKDYMEALKAAGIKSEYTVYKAVPHAFTGLDFLPEASLSIEYAAKVLQENLAAVPAQ